MKPVLYAALLLVSIVESSSVAAQDDRWKPVGINGDAVAWVDSKSLRRTGTKVRAWIRWDWMSPQKTRASTPKEYRAEKHLAIHDCANRTTTTLQIILYADFAAIGGVVESFSADEATAKPLDIVPETIGEQVLEFVCEATSPKKKVSWAEY